MAPTNSNQQDPAGLPNSLDNPADDSLQEVKITKADWEKVQAALGRISGLQSERDIAKQTKSELSKLSEDLRPLLERAHSLGSQNKSLDEAINQIQAEQTDQDFRASVLEIARVLREGGSFPDVSGKTKGVDLTAVLSEFELDPTDPFVASQLQGKQFSTQAEAEAFAGKIFRQKVTAPNPNPAQQHTRPAKSVSVNDPEELEQVTAEYLEKFKNPNQNRERLAVLAQRMQELGG